MAYVCLATLLKLNFSYYFISFMIQHWYGHSKEKLSWKFEPTSR